MSGKIQAAEMRVLRLIIGLTRRDRVRNEVVREKLGVEPVLEYIEKSQLRWYGHVKRLETTRYARKYLEWQPRGRRPRGRPRTRWIQNIGDGIRRRNTTIEEMEQQERYKDKVWWRTFISVPEDSVQLTGPVPNRRWM